MMIPSIVTRMGDTICNQAKDSSPFMIRFNKFFAVTIKIPIPINTVARPTLKNRINTIPNKIRCKATAPKRTKIAAGQGSIPPVTPKINKSHQLALAGISWVCV